jgi:hypothetical protein
MAKTKPTKNPMMFEEDEPRVEKAPEQPKLLPIQQLELVINQALMRNDMQMLEVIGFFELKLIEMKEGWRMQVQQRIQAMQAQAANETSN